MSSTSITKSNLRLMTVALIHPDGKQEEIHASWDAVKKALDDATLEPVWLNDGACLLVDEDGLAKNLEPNYLASQVCSRDIVGRACLVRRHLVNKVLG